MKIVGVAACTSGIAHTYIAREKLVRAATDMGHEVHIETQGTIGTENELKASDILAADVVIIATDIKVSGGERFAGKKIYEVPTSLVIKSPKGLITKIQQDLGL